LRILTDGIDDVFIGGAKGSAGKIYVNKGNDSFAPIKQFDLDSDAIMKILQLVF
jgi:hypothetical protein